MVKKLFYLLFSVIVLQVVFIACCKDVTMSTKITALNLSIVDRLGIEFPDSSELELDSTFIELATTAEHLTSSLLFIERSYATRRCEDDYALDNRISSIEVTSDKTLFGLPPGELLNEFVGTNISGNMKNINGWLWNLNSHFPHQQKIPFIFFENPNSDEFFQLKIKLNFQDGSNMIAETQHIKIK